MTEPDDSVLFDQLAERFLDAVRDGEEPVVEEWVARHPEHAEAIRELFPTILAMEEMKRADESRPPRLSLAPNDRLGDFRIVREIGRGGMGVVYEAVQESLGRRVAVKVLPALGDVRRVKRFEREAKTAARLHHSNIVPIFGVGTHDGWHYYVMQVIRGVGLDAVVGWLRTESEGDESSAIATPVASDAPAGETVDDAVNATAGQATAVASHELSVAQLVRAMRTGSFRPAAAPTASTSAESAAAEAMPEPAPLESSFENLPADPGPVVDSRARYWRSVAWVGRQVGSALAYAHAQGVLHRDIKPANLLIDARGVVWVTDFGLATANEGDGLTRSGDLLGTLQYMAPEQLRGDYDERSDVYALGLTLYELLTLQPAFRDGDRGRLLESVAKGVGARPSALRPGVPRDLETIVLHALHVEPRHRYASAAELADDLQNFLDDRPIQARRATVLEHGWRWCRRNRALAGLGALAIVGLISAAAAGWIGWVSTRDALSRERAQFQVAQAASERAARNLRSATRAFEEIFATLAGPPRLTLVAAASGDATIDAETGVAASGEADFAWAAAGTQVSGDQAALLERLLSFYEDLAGDDGNNLQLAVETASATRRVGDIQLQLGRAADAVVSYERSLNALASAVAGGVSYDPVLAAAIRNDLAQARLEGGDPRAAREELLQVVASLQDDERLAARYERARAHELLGGLARFAPPRGQGIERRGPGPGGGGGRPGRPWLSGRGTGERGAPLELGGPPPFPDGPDRIGPDGIGPDGIGPDGIGPDRGPPGGEGPGGPPDGSREGPLPGDPVGALSHFAEAWRLNRSLVAERPGEPEFVLAAARTARLYARVQRQWGGGLAGRVVRLRIGEAEAALRRLVDEHPDQPAYRAELAALLMEWANPEAANELEAERESVAEGLALAGALHAANPELVAYRRLHRRALVRSAELEMVAARRDRRQGRAVELSDHLVQACAQLQAALTLIDDGVGGEAERVEQRHAQMALLSVLVGLDRDEEARQLFEQLRAQGVLRELVFEQMQRRLRGGGGGGERLPRPMRDRLRDR